MEGLQQLFEDGNEEDQAQLLISQKTTYMANLTHHFTLREEDIHNLFRESKVVNEEAWEDLELKCAYCLGIVYKPMECRACNTPYCKICIDAHQSQNQGEWKCPKNCQENKYQKLNRFIRNRLNKVDVTCCSCQK